MAYDAQYQRTIAENYDRDYALRRDPSGDREFYRDLGYDLVARTRYRLFGRHDACPLPDPRHRARFLDQSG